MQASYSTCTPVLTVSKQYLDVSSGWCLIPPEVMDDTLRRFRGRCRATPGLTSSYQRPSSVLPAAHLSKHAELHSSHPAACSCPLRSGPAGSPCQQQHAASRHARQLPEGAAGCNGGAGACGVCAQHSPWPAQHNGRLNSLPDLHMEAERCNALSLQITTVIKSVQATYHKHVVSGFEQHQRWSSSAPCSSAPCLAGRAQDLNSAAVAGTRPQQRCSDST